MKDFLTLSSKGQITLPAHLRRQLGLNRGDRLEATIDPERRQVTIRPVESIDQLSERISGYAKRRDPVLDVDSYYQEHRSE